MKNLSWVTIGALGVAAVFAMSIIVMVADDSADTTTARSETPTTTVATTRTTEEERPPSTTTAPRETLAPSTTSAPPGTTAAPLAAPTVQATTGAGSGEVALQWSRVDGATGYRVLRIGADGTTSSMAEIDVVTGTANAQPEVVNVWSDSHSYVPASGALSSPDDSAVFHYVDVGLGERCYEVVALREAVTGTSGPPVCARPA